MQEKIEENEKLFNHNLDRLKIKYEKEVESYKDNFKTCNENINKKYKTLINNENKKINEEMENIEKEYNNSIRNLNYNQKIYTNKYLLLVIQILINTQESYPDNYYNNSNIINIINRYYESKDENIDKILNNDLNNELLHKEEEEKKYENEIKEIEELRNMIINDEKANQKLIDNNLKKILSMMKIVIIK